MKSVYFKDNDILTIRFSDKPIARESSIDCYTHGSYDASGNIVELVLVEAYAHHRHLFNACHVAHITNVRRVAGSYKTRTKAEVARANGMKGGRPKKIQPEGIAEDRENV